MARLNVAQATADLRQERNIRLKAKRFSCLQSSHLCVQLCVARTRLADSGNKRQLQSSTLNSVAVGCCCCEAQSFQVLQYTTQPRGVSSDRALLMMQLALCGVLVVLPFAHAHFLGYGAKRLRAFRGQKNVQHHLQRGAAIDPSVVEKRFTAAVIDNFAPIEQQQYWTGAGESLSMHPSCTITHRIASFLWHITLVRCKLHS